MSAIAYIRKYVIPATFDMLPAKMDTPVASAMLLAIGLQESRFEHREQIGGPAHGFWQFESGGGIKGVLNHDASRPHILLILDELGYPINQNACYEAIVHSDILACAFARLLLWTYPKALAVRDNVDGAWFQYLQTWRPGRPHRATFDDFYEQAWTMTED